MEQITWQIVKAILIAGGIIYGIIVTIEAYKNVRLKDTKFKRRYNKWLTETKMQKK